MKKTRYIVIAELPTTLDFSKNFEVAWGSDDADKCAEYARNAAERDPGPTYAVYTRQYGYTGCAAVAVTEDTIR